MAGRSRLRRVSIYGGVALAVLAAVVVVRALMLTPPEVRVPTSQVSLPELDVDGAAQRLSGALRHATVSLTPEGEDGPGGDPAAFDALWQHMEASFPKVFEVLEVESLGHSRLMWWKGRDESLPPILLMAHIDVVPVEPGTEDDWTQPPFSGAIDQGYVWGRGAIDDKTAAMGILEGIDLLLQSNFVPRRSIALAYGHDEEIGGESGAAVIAKTLTDRGQRFDFVLDEGGVVVVDTIPGVEPPVALIGVAEKGYASFELTVEVTGGHSSMPPPQTAVGILSAAVARIEADPLPAEVSGATQAMFEALAPHMDFGPRLALANLWLLERPLIWALSSQPPTNASIRTTTAATVFTAGSADNVLPAQAQAIVNFRIVPGQTADDVAQHVKKAIDDPRVKIAVYREAWDPSPMSPIDTPGFAALTGTIRQVFPDAVIAPSLVVGATDSRRYQHLANGTYRFLPIVFTDADRERIHGTDERLSVAAYGNAVRFYATLIQNAAG